MKSIEERAKEYSLKDFDGYYTGRENAMEEGYIAGAKEQKAIDEEVRLKKCDDMTEAEYNHETAFVDWYLENGKGMPAYSDAIEWARKEVINRACEWINKYLHLFVMKGNIIYPKLAQEFRKAMEEQMCCANNFKV